MISLLLIDTGFLQFIREVLNTAMIFSIELKLCISKKRYNLKQKFSCENLIQLKQILLLKKKIKLHKK